MEERDTKVCAHEPCQWLAKSRHITNYSGKGLSCEAFFRTGKIFPLKMSKLDPRNSSPS